MLLCDAHAHLGNDTEWEERTGKGILSLICATGPEEAGKLFSRLEWLKGRAVIPTAGLHPWYADQYTVQDMEPYIRRCPVVGEIGMDSVWCQVPLPIQERVFREQLAMACSLKKPVVLHTKGQEKAIASILKEYPNRYLVHWYSCEEYSGGVSGSGLLLFCGTGCVVESRGGTGGKAGPQGPDPGGNGRAGSGTVGL